MVELPAILSSHRFGVLSCTVVGNNDGLADGFTSGGVNLANVKDCIIDGNSFSDCYGAAYIDTGSVDGLQVSNNTVTRGWEAVGLASTVHAETKYLDYGK